jgi:hypothetical protein
MFFARFLFFVAVVLCEFHRIDFFDTKDGFVHSGSEQAGGEVGRNERGGR